MISEISPKEIPSIEIFLKSMILHVKVPVLSLKMYSIWPNSSFRLDEFTLVGILVLFWTNSSSFDIAMPWASFTDSRVTSNEIGTKLLKNSLLYYKKGLFTKKQESNCRIARRNCIPLNDLWTRFCRLRGREGNPFRLHTKIGSK